MLDRGIAVGSRRRLPAIVCAFILLFVCRPAFALDPNRTLTQYLHRIWQLPQGLPDATVTSILQASDGYLWLGTETGLVRFDGVRFSGLGTQVSSPLQHAWIRSLMEDRQHRMWVGTNEMGIVRFENGVTTPFLPDTAQPRDSVQCLVSDGHENLWACTPNGMARLNEGKVSLYGTSSGLPTNNIRAACEAADGTLLAAGDGPVLSAWTGTSFVTRTLTSIPAYSSIRALLCSEDGTVWAGTTNGLVRIEDGAEHLITVDDGLADNSIYCLTEGSERSTVWIGTKNGFSRLHSGKLESYRTEDGLSQSTVYSIFEDREGSLWVGTKHGLNQFLDGRTIPYTVSEGLPTDNTGPVLQDHNGTIWIGTLGSGLSRLDNSHHFSVLTKKDGLAGDRVYALAEDRDGDLWAGTDGGLNRLHDGHIERTYTTAQGLPENRIAFLYRDHAGVLWIGTATGVMTLLDGKLVRTDKQRDSSRPLILGGGEDGNGHFLASTEAGLEIYLNHAFQEFAPDQTPLRQVDAFYTDRDGYVWMGTAGAGLRLLKDGKIFSYFMRDGLFDNEIYGIASDNEDRLWMASSKGIFSVNRADLLKRANGEIQSVVSKPYSPLDGLRTIECKPGVQPAVSRMHDGRLWFSTIRGLLVLDPEKLRRNTTAPPVAIESVSVNGQTESPDRIDTLSPGRKDLEFRYTALSFLVPNAITFLYILEGYDKNWTDASTRRVAYYTNLPPGDFRFRVTACNSDGICNETGNAVAFTLEHPYYQKPWFLALGAAFLTFAIWLAWQQRVRRLKQQFDLVLSERSRIARELHDTLIQGFSGITMGMQAVSSGLPQSDQRSQLEELVEDAAHCLTQARQSIAGLRGLKELRLPLCNAIAQAATRITEETGLTLNLMLEQGAPPLPEDLEDNMVRIVQEAVSNAVRHSNGKTIEVRLSVAADRICLSVQDDGEGIRNADGVVSAGHYGLTGMRERARQIGADFELVTEPAMGTAVQVVLPLPANLQGGTV